MAMAPAAMKFRWACKRGLVSVSAWPERRPVVGAGFYFGRHMVMAFADWRGHTWARIWWTRRYEGDPWTTTKTERPIP